MRPEDPRDAAEFERENAALDAQLKLLVKTEQRLYRSRLEIDQQLARTRVLEHFALECATALDTGQILALGLRALEQLFTFDWCMAVTSEGGAVHVLASTHPLGAAPSRPAIPDVLARLSSAPAVAVLRLPEDLDTRLLIPIWPEASPSPEVASQAWLVTIRLSERSAPAPTFVLACVRRPRAPRALASQGLSQGGGPYLHLFTTHLERALENARLTQALRQRTAELGRSLSELEQTQARLADAAKMEAIGRLAGGVAHDFNNLLTVIGGHAALLASQLGPMGGADSHAAKISVAVEKGASIAAQLLAFGRRQMLTRTAVDLNSMVSATTQMLGRLLGEHVELQLHLDSGIPRVAADRVQMDQVLLNLLVNARDALPDGGTIRVTTRAAGARDLARVHDTRPAGDYVLLEVSDDGLGMDRPTLARIFEPFYTTKGPGQGNGLGLAVVHGIVRQSEGHLFVESAPGRGATFGLLLPVSQAESTAHVRAPLVPNARAGARILLVEDEAMIRDIARQVLERAGHTVSEAANGREALARFELDPQAVDLLVTDVVMPLMGGVALARELRTQRPELRVLYMSGYSQELSDLGPSAGGVENFLAKPFTAAALIDAVALSLAVRTAPVARG